MLTISLALTAFASLALAQYGSSPTTTSPSSSNSAVSSVGAPGAAVTVQVGPGGRLVYEPDFVNAAIGDEIVFEFNPKNHSVTESSSYGSPCVPKPGGTTSGFQPVGANATANTTSFRTVVNSTEPALFHCGQTGHCAKGMVFMINPSLSETIEGFTANAAGNLTSNSTTPSGSAANTDTAATASSTGNSKNSAAISPSVNFGLPAVLAVVGGFFILAL